MAIGVRKFFRIAADVPVTNSAVLVTTGLTARIEANQSMFATFWVPFTVGAAGGVRLQVLVPAGGVIFSATIALHNTVAPADPTATQNASAVFTNALANAGRHWVEVKVFIVNGSTAGNVDLQMAQNTADATPMTALRGGTMDVVTL